MRADAWAIACLLLSGFPLTAAAQNCDVVWAQPVVIEGSVEVREREGAPWRAVNYGDLICTGYTIQVNAFSRAILLLPDQTTARLGPNTSVTISETQRRSFWFELWRGLVLVISRDPRELGFGTPYANAGLEGTEFLLEAAADETAVTVVEGEVLVSNDSGALSVPSGSQAIARSQQAPASSVIADPFERLRWTAYYARILDAPLPDPAESPPADRTGDPDYYFGRAAARLRFGAPDEAEEDIGRGLSLSGAAAVANALRTVIALARGDKDTARGLAAEAVRQNPDSATAWIASSHADQARFDFAAALASAARAADLAAESAVAWVRLAEARLNTDDYQGAAAAAERALELDPTLGHAQTTLGFALLANPLAALAAFERAVALEPGSPWARVGLGLALVRERRLDEARLELELAVSLDPRNAALRSYMAKTYGEVDRPELQDSQLDLAQALDPDDLTPYLYRALTDQTSNRPVQAFRAMRQAVELNDNRAVSRSNLHLDEDLAVRSLGVARMYTELGFTNVALLDGWKGTTADRGDYASHRLLADLLATQPRHEMARVDEFYQTQLLQPVSLAPVQPQFAEPNLFILDRLGPTELASSELGPLVSRNGVSVHGSAIAAGNNTEGLDVAVGGLHDRVSFGVGVFDYHTDGFRENNDLDQRVSNALIQFRPNHETSVLAELRSTETEQGYLRMFFDPDNYNPNARQQESVDSLRLGLRRDLSPDSTIIGSIIAEDQSASFTQSAFFGSGNSFRSDFRRTGATIDVQYLLRHDRWQLASGLRRLEQDEEQVSTLSLPPPIPSPPPQFSEANIEHTTAYTYADVVFGERFTATFGLSADDVSTAATDADRVNPKLGLLIEPNSETTIRLSALRTLQGPFVSRYNLQPHLEPTHVAGFNQFFFGAEGDRTERSGIAVDHRFSENLHGGLELAEREVESQTLTELPDLTTIIDVTQRDETLRRGYLYWAPGEQLSFAAEYRYDEFDVAGASLTDNLSDVETHRLPLTVNYFSRGRLRFGATATYVDQHGTFWPIALDPTNPPTAGVYGEDSFWVVDLSMGYRLPNKRGLIALRVDNAFDKDFFFQDTDPEIRSIMPERMLSLRLTLAY